MPKADENRAVSVGYSLPRWLHKRVAVEAAKEGMNASQLLHQAVRLYFRMHNMPYEPVDDETHVTPQAS